MNCIENIFERLRQEPDRIVLQEWRGDRLVTSTAGELLRQISAARWFLANCGVRQGDRCVLLAHNSIRWVALDLALMAEGIIVVPLYARQSPVELVTMMKDCQASLVCCDDPSLSDAIAHLWPEGARRVLFDAIFAAPGTERVAAPVPRTDADAVTIIYTSGTSGEAKGVILTSGNLNHMLSCTGARLDLLMGQRQQPDRVFHYLPFCFAGSWILLLSCLSRKSVLTLSTDLARLADDIQRADANYFLNVPAVLERIRAGVENQLKTRGGAALAIFERARAAWQRRQSGEPRAFDGAWLALANALIFSAIRKRLGVNVKALICGSAPLAKETQCFFLLLGVPVLQVYGLTETTAICTMDHPHHIESGRVGPAISGIEMKVGENDEILVRGPHIFPGYWNRPEETRKVLRDGWFHTGDQGAVDSSGNWSVVGRLKNLLILNSGHNIAPEPIEEMLLHALPGAQQVMLVGNGRSFLSAIVTGEVPRERVDAAVAGVNATLPHYKQIRAFHVEQRPFTIENGLLTANGKLKRDAIATRFEAAIEDLCCRKGA